MIKNFLFFNKYNGIGNTLNVASKEFNDLMNSQLVIFISLIYVILIFKTIYDFYNSMLSTHIVDGWRLVNSLLIGLNFVLTYYGSFIGIVIGFSSIASEKNNKALNSLIVKPLYRDTIINGKLLGAFSFMICIFGLVTALYTSVLLIIAGNSIAPIILSYLSNLPILFVLSLSYVMIFLTLSMLVAMLVEEQAFALILGVVLIVISDIIASNNVAVFLANIISPGNIDAADFIARLSPIGIMKFITQYLYGITPNNLPIYSIIPSSSFEIEVMKLLLYLLIAIILSYIAFIKRDIA